MTDGRDVCMDAFQRCVGSAASSELPAAEVFGPPRAPLPTFDYVGGELAVEAPVKRKRKRKKMPKGCHCPKGSKYNGYGSCFKMVRGKIRLPGKKKTRIGKRPVAVKLICK